MVALSLPPPEFFYCVRQQLTSDSSFAAFSSVSQATVVYRCHQRNSRLFTTVRLLQSLSRSGASASGAPSVLRTYLRPPSFRLQDLALEPHMVTLSSATVEQLHITFPTHTVLDL